ncbi:MAG: DUF5684 domain-containing protein [Ruthenibacterium sp.]
MAGISYTFFQLSPAQTKIALIGFAAGLLMSIIGMWVVFTKASRPGWAAVVPFYNMYTEFQIAWGSGWLFLLLMVPVADVVVFIMLQLKLAKAFGKGNGFAIGLILLNPLFTLMLAFGDAKYQGVPKKAA